MGRGWRRNKGHTLERETDNVNLAKPDLTSEKGKIDYHQNYTNLGK